VKVDRYLLNNHDEWKLTWDQSLKEKVHSFIISYFIHHPKRS
jgi:hypothetical protein